MISAIAAPPSCPGNHASRIAPTLGLSLSGLTLTRCPVFSTTTTLPHCAAAVSTIFNSFSPRLYASSLASAPSLDPRVSITTAASARPLTISTPHLRNPSGMEIAYDDWTLDEPPPHLRYLLPYTATLSPSPSGSVPLSFLRSTVPSAATRCATAAHLSFASASAPARAAIATSPQSAVATTAGRIADVFIVPLLFQDLS